MIGFSRKERKKRLNAQMRRLICPKSSLMVFSELFKDIPIHLQEHPLHNACMSYTATLEVRYNFILCFVK